MDIIFIKMKSGMDIVAQARPADDPVFLLLRQPLRLVVTGPNSIMPVPFAPITEAEIKIPVSEILFTGTPQPELKQQYAEIFDVGIVTAPEGALQQLDRAGPPGRKSKLVL